MNTFPACLCRATVIVITAILAGCGQPAERPFNLTALASPAGLSSAEPHLSRSPSGQVVLSWLTRHEADVSLNFASLTDTGWSASSTVARGDNWFVNWADFPSVAPITDEFWAAHWLIKRAGGTYAYDVGISVSTDGGRTWSEPSLPHTDGTRTEHGFVSLFTTPGGAGVMWLDGRNTSQDGHADHESHASAAPATGMTLRTAIITPAQAITAEQLVDELVCDCCQTDVAIAASGPVAVYRNRTDKEIRDIYVSRLVDGRWLPGKPVADDGWEIAGCPVNGPAIAAEGSNVAVAWFTAANATPRVRFARSNNGGDSFAAAMDIEVAGVEGRVDVDLLDDGDAVVSWMHRGQSGPGELRLRRVSADSQLGPVHVVAEISSARLSGFPQMIRRGNDLVLAWTDAAGQASNIRTALVRDF